MSNSQPPPLPPQTSIFSLDALFDNPVFAGGIGLAGLGAAAALGRRWAVQGAGLIKHRLLVDLEISKEDPSYPWILAWLTLPRPQGGFITSKLTRIHHLSMKTTSRAAGNRSNQPYFMAQPGYGRHIIRHKNAYVSVNREKQTSYDMKTGEPFETVTLTTLYAHRDIFEDIFRQAHWRPRRRKARLSCIQHEAQHGNHLETRGRNDLCSR